MPSRSVGKDKTSPMRIIALCYVLIISLSVSPRAQTTVEIPVKDGVIHTEVFGEGTPILIINGGPGMSSEGFRSLASRLSEANKAIIFDQRGTGRSRLEKVNTSTVTMDLMVDDIEAIRTYLGIENWVVLGHSFGGMLGSYYTSKHPDKVSGLILSSSGGVDMELFENLNITSRLSDENQDSLRYWNRRISNGDTSFQARLKRGLFLAPAYLYDQEYIPAIAQRLTQGNTTINGLVYRDMRRIGFDCKPTLSDFRNPVLIIQGKHDIIPEYISLKARDLFSDSKLVILEYSGHYGWLEESDLFFTEIMHFLGSV